MFRRLVIVSILFSGVAYDRVLLYAREDCQGDYTKCSPKGITASDAPDVGTGLSGLFLDLLGSISKVQKQRREQSEPLRIKKRTLDGRICCKLHPLMHRPVLSQNQARKERSVSCYKILSYLSGT